jgi:hypothetical protein
MNNSILSNLLQNGSESGRPSISDRLATSFDKIKSKFNFEDILKFIANSSDRKIRNANPSDAIANSFDEQNEKSNQIMGKILLFMTRVEKDELEHQSDMLRLKSEDSAIKDKRHKEILDIFNNEVSKGGSLSEGSPKKSTIKKSSALKKPKLSKKNQGLLGNLINMGAFGTGILIASGEGGMPTGETPSTPSTPGGTTPTTPSTPGGTTPQQRPPNAPSAERVTGVPPAPSSEREPGLRGIAQKESGNDYNRLVNPVAGAPADTPRRMNLEKMTLNEVLNQQRQMIGSSNYPSSALGKYQMVYPTLQAAIRTLNLDPEKTKFDAATQDKIFTEFLTKTKRPDVEEYLSKEKVEKKDEDSAILALAQEFAAVPVPYAVHRPKMGGLPARDLKAGESYYEDGPSGANHAGFTVDEIRTMLMEERQLRNPSVLTPKTSSIEPVGSNRISDNSDLLKGNQIAQSMPPAVVVLNNTMINNQNRRTTITSNDRNINPYLLGKMA